MPRKPSIVPSAKLQVHIPAPLKARIDLHLWSELENRVPQGAHARFIIDLLNEYFKSRGEPRD